MPENNNLKPDIADNLIKWIGTKTSLVVHTFLFAGIFSLSFIGFNLDHILLVLTTFLSIEAIYLAIFIQISVNRNTESLDEVEDEIDEIQEDVEEDEVHDKQIDKVLQSIESRLKELQDDLVALKKKRSE